MSEDPVKYEPLRSDTTARDATTVALERIQALEEHLAGHGDFATRLIRIEALRAAATVVSSRPQWMLETKDDDGYTGTRCTSAEKAVVELAEQFAAYLETGE